jgi:adenylate cyclase
LPGEKVERRLAAILAADVAGYSRLMGADEEGTLARLKASRKVIVDPAIAEHKGRIVKTTGDGMLVEFASSVDAVTCAIVIQEKMAERSAGGAEPRIVFRIGINVGEVIIDGDDIFGDGVNVAARVENECEPGGVCISGNAFEQIRGKTRFAFDDLGEKTLKNIERPVRLYAVRATATTAAISTTPSNAGDPLPLPDKPSIAVLPFHNMSGDPEQEYFADGMVDEIITALSRFRSLFVIARSSTFIYKGQAIDIKRVSRDLGVRYVLEGSLRKGGGRVRVTAQLIDALSGAHLWADRYDRDLTDVFAVQDEITASVAAVIEPALAEAERQRVLRKSPASLDAWETYQRGLWHFYKFSADENKTAQVYFLRAIATHPDFAPGHYGLALAQQLDFWLYSTRSWTDITGLALKEAQIGVSLDDKDSMAHAMLSFVQQLCGEWEPAIAEGRTAINLNPNSVWSMMAMGVALGWGGYPKDGVDYLRGAMRASPHDPMTRFWTFWTGIFQYHLREYEATVISMREVIRVGSALDGHAVRWVAQALAQLGRVPDAKAELERAIAISPVFFDKFVRQRPPWYRPDDYALSIEGLRKAGWAG